MEVSIGIIQRSPISFYMRFQFDMSFFNVLEKWKREFAEFEYSPLYAKGKHVIIPGLLDGYLYVVKPRGTRFVYRVHGNKRACFLEANTFQNIIQNGLLWLPTPKRTNILARKDVINVDLSVTPFPLVSTELQTSNPIGKFIGKRMTVKLSQLLDWLSLHPITQYTLQDCILGIDWV